MPALGGVQVVGPNGGVSNNLMLPTAGLTNFVPDPAALVSTNYLGMPAPNGLPAVGPGTTNFPTILGTGGQLPNAAPASGTNHQFDSITKPFRPDDSAQKYMYAQELKKQMVEKSIQDENERKKAEEWDEYHERRIERELGTVRSF